MYAVLSCLFVASLLLHDQLLAHGDGYGLSAVRRVDLLKQEIDVLFDRVFADSEDIGDVAVCEALD